MLPHNYYTCRFVTDSVVYNYGNNYTQTSLFGPFAEMESYATHKGPCEEHFLAVMSLANAR